MIGDLKEKAPNRINSPGPKADSQDECAHHVAQSTCSEVLITAAAEFARLGWSLIEDADGGFTASRWNHSRRLGDLAEVQGFLRQIWGVR